MLHFFARIALLVFLLSLVALALFNSLFSSNPVVIACQLAAAMLMVWARTAFPKGTFRTVAAPAGTAVIQTGPYRLIRHPMYAGALLLVWASIAGHPSIVSVAIGLAMSVAIVGKIVHEERLLRQSLAGYVDYARSTKALVPFVV